jgi:hypothetical protein
MRKLIAVGVLIGGLLAGAGPAAAQGFQGGIGDPLTLIISGALVPFLNNQNAATGTVATLEVMSPVGWNDGSQLLDGNVPLSRPALHLVFYNETCGRVTSRFLPLTRDDVGFINITQNIAAVTGNGLVAIASSPQNNGFNLVPLENPIHTRMYLFNVGTGQSRVLEPIAIDTFDFPTGSVSTIATPAAGFYSGGVTVWSPLRTGAVFFSPLETSSVNTRLILICPRSSIQGDNTTHNATSGAFPQQQPSNIPSVVAFSGFPGINHPFNAGGPGFPSGPFALQGMSGIIYDDHETHLADFSVSCDCVTELSVLSLDPLIYSNPVLAGNGTVTELLVTSNTEGNFTGYKQSFTVGAPINNFSHRLSNGNKLSIQGVVAGQATSPGNTANIACTAAGPLAPCPPGPAPLVNFR